MPDLRSISFPAHAASAAEASGGFHLRFVERLACVGVTLLVIVAIGAAWLPLADPLSLDLVRILAPPSASHWLGTDELGRDLLSRLVFASQSSLLITAGGTAFALSLAMLFGVTAGYLGGWWDRLIGLIIDAIWTVPFVVLLLLILAVTGISTLSLILCLGGINWVTAARVLRTETAALRRRDFIRTARSLGANRRSILVRELLPNLFPTLLALVGYGAAEILTVETGLAFLGLSLPAPTPTWGGMLAEGLSYFASDWWLPLLPALAITLTLLIFQILARACERWAKRG
jgi:peptide/nickel transport system permease protein